MNGDLNTERRRWERCREGILRENSVFSLVPYIFEVGRPAAGIDYRSSSGVQGLPHSWVAFCEHRLVGIATVHLYHVYPPLCISLYELYRHHVTKERWCCFIYIPLHRFQCDHRILGTLHTSLYQYLSERERIVDMRNWWSHKG